MAVDADASCTRSASGSSDVVTVMSARFHRPPATARSR
jgi:hypothetical protein